MARIFLAGVGATHAFRRTLRVKCKMDTDMILGICAAVGMTICGVCVVVNAWRSTPHPHMKVSRSDPDLSILENAIPSASAYRIQPRADTGSTQEPSEA
jgi:hypothetical protein